MSATRRRQLGFGAAILPIVSMAALFPAGAFFFELNTEFLIVVLLCSAAVAGAVALRHGHSWDDVQRATGEKLAAALPALLILLAIGMLIASWVFSGTIPFLVYWGTKLVRPALLVPTAFLATALMSTFTGTSWGSAGTVGVALMGTAAALDAPLAATAGAVVSGAYFGDKLSPLSDSTNISAIGARAPLYAHIRHMLYTAVPSFVLGLLLYGGVAALLPVSSDGAPTSAAALLTDIEQVFRLGPLVLIPPAVVILCIVRSVPPALAITLSAVCAVAVGVAGQGFAAQDAVMALVSGFRLSTVEAVGIDPTTLSPAFVKLAVRGGLYGMANTLIVVLSAFLLAGGMQASGSLELLIERMLGAVRGVFGLIAATMAAGATMIAMTSHGGVTALVIGGLFQQAYAERGLAPENLSRSIEDSVTLTEPLMPWTVSAAFMATTLGVSTLDYAPWAIFCYGGPVFSLLLAGCYGFTGFGLRRLAATASSSGAR